MSQSLQIHYKKGYENIIITCHPIFLMAPKKNAKKKPAQKKQRKTGSDIQLFDTLTQVLSSALSKQDDFIVTYETDANNEDRKKIHVMTGKLISPCMLGTLKNRVELLESDESKRLTMRWK